MQAKTIIRSLVLAALFLMVPAHADFHFMKIVEIFPGTAAAPNAQYVVLQMYASGQQFVANHELTVYDADGAEVGSFAFQQNLSNGANQARILIATAEAASFFDVSADLMVPPSLLADGGKVCFAGAVDCVAWGAWSGSSSGVGTAFNVDGGLLSGRAAIRRLDIAGGSGSLDAGDDTNDCASDFVFGLPEPGNNAGQFGSIPAATCGNDAIEGLEQCDDGNLANGDGCSSTCAIDAVVQQPVEQDFDGDGEADVFRRNRSSGRNVVWRSGYAGTTRATHHVGDTGWTVVQIGDFDGDGRADAFWRHQVNGRNAIWLSGDRSTPQPTLRVVNLDWEVVAAGDFDGDGRADAFWRNQSHGRNVIWEAGKADAARAAITVRSIAWEVVGTGDFDGDGRDDLFWRHQESGRNAIWLSANGATQVPTLRVSNLAWQVEGVADFNGDGNDDVFWRNRSDGRNVIWLSGDARTTQAVTRVTSPDWRVVGAADYTGDGRGDLFWRHFAAGRNTIWVSADAGNQLRTLRVSNLDWQVMPHTGPEPAEPDPDPDPEPEPGPVLTISDEAIAEGNSGERLMVFTVQLSAAASAPVTYSIGTTAFSATAGSDYTSVDLSGETIPAGATSRTFSVPILGDSLEEGNEYFNVGVSDVTGGNVTVGDALARGTIQDDDYTY